MQQKTEGLQASDIYLLMQVEGLAAPDDTDVDLRLGCPGLSILERISLVLSLVLIYRPQEHGQLSWLVATFVSGSRTGFEPETCRVPTLHLNQSVTLTAGTNIDKRYALWPTY